MSVRRRGLTLLEVAVTIALVAILAVPTGLVVSQLLRVVMLARDSNEAMSLARYELERLDAIDDFFAPDLRAPAVGGGGTVTLPNYRGTRFTLYRTVICDRWEGNAFACIFRNSNAARKRIEVTVADPTLGTQQFIVLGKLITESTQPSITLTTYRTKGVQYGL